MPFFFSFFNKVVYGFYGYQSGIIGSMLTKCYNPFLRFLANNMWPFGEHGVMGTASIEALCFRILYVLI